MAYFPRLLSRILNVNFICPFRSSSLFTEYFLPQLHLRLPGFGLISAVLPDFASDACYLLPNINCHAFTFLVIRKSATRWVTKGK